MTIYGAEVFPNPIPSSIAELRAPPSNSHQTRPVICRKTYPNENHPRNLARVESHSIKTKPKLEPYSIETRPTPLLPVDLYQTRMLELVKKPYETGRLCRAMYLLQRVVSGGYRPDSCVCTQLIQGFFHVKDVEKAIEVMNILESKGEPDLYAYNAMIDGFFKLNRIDDADEWLYRLRASGHAPNIVTYTIIIDGLCRMGKLHLAFKLLDELMATNCRPTVHTYTILLKATVAERGINEAMELLNEMHETGVEPDIMSYGIVLKALMEQGKCVEVDKLVREMLSMGFDPDEITYSYDVILSGICRYMMADVAMGLLKNMQSYPDPVKPNVISYNMVLLCLCKAHRVSDAIELLVQMIENGCLPNERTYTIVIYGIGFAGKHLMAIALASSLVERGVISQDAYERLSTIFPISNGHRQLTASES